MRKLIETAVLFLLLLNFIGCTINHELKKEALDSMQSDKQLEKR